MSVISAVFEQAFIIYHSQKGNRKMTCRQRSFLGQCHFQNVPHTKNKTCVNFNSNSTIIDCCASQLSYCIDTVWNFDQFYQYSFS
jgi:hypothetical protein